jgi:hypothetical protein
MVGVSFNASRAKFMATHPRPIIDDGDDYKGCVSVIIND